MPLSPEENPVLMDITDQLIQLTEQIAAFNMHDKTGFKKNFPNGSTCGFSMSDSAGALHMAWLPVDKNGMVQPDVAYNAIEANRMHLEDEDTNHDGKISLEEATPTKNPFTNLDAEKFIAKFSPALSDQASKDAFAKIARDAARDNVLSVAEDKAMTKFLEDHGIKLIHDLVDQSAKGHSPVLLQKNDSGIDREKA